MNILSKLTFRSLKLNKKRTIVTIIGIVLATALITGVTTMLASSGASTIQYAKQHFGDYHLEITNVPSNDIERIQNLDNIENTFLTQHAGYGIFEYAFKEMPIQVLNFSDDAFHLLGIELIEGSFPKSDNEIVISNQIEQLENIKLSIGSTISLPIQGEETVTKDYTIVGIVNIMNQEIEPLYNASTSNKYYTFLSYLDTNHLNGNYNLYLRYSNFSNRIETLVNILEIDDATYQKLKAKTAFETEEKLLDSNENESLKYICIPNLQLIALELGNDFDQTNQMLYTVAIVLLIIIILTSAYCIKNSFTISITEKVKQYGLLASVGTTPKQIKRSVLLEACVLGCIGIPLGIVLGTGSIYLLLHLIQDNLMDELFGMEFIFSTNLISIAFAILFSALTIYLSARTSAKKAAKISPMKAIRSNQDIQIKSKKMKSPKWVKKLFGIGGVIAYKNMKRNKRSYRTTVVSIIMSVSAFIALITFTNYAFEVVELYYANYHFNIMIDGDDYSKLVEIAQDPHIDTYALRRMCPSYIENGDKHFSADVRTLNTRNHYDSSNIILLAFGKQEFERFIHKLGLSYQDVKDKGILIDTITDYAEIDGKNKLATFRIYDYQPGDVLEIYTYEETEGFPIEIATVTTEEPLAYSGINTGFQDSTHASLIVSDELFDEFISILSNTKFVNKLASLYIVTNNSEELLEYIEQNYSDNYDYIENVDNQLIEQRALFTTISIFLYTFIIVTSLIGITNIFNTITTSMELRQKEFAHLKSIGMTKKEFNRMIRLENIFLGLKALIIGIPLGLVFSYIVHLAFRTNAIMDYIFPYNGVLISILAVFLILWCIMRYTLNKINKQNIIETIQRDNV